MIGGIKQCETNLDKASAQLAADNNRQAHQAASVDPAVRAAGSVEQAAAVAALGASVVQVGRASAEYRRDTSAVAGTGQPAAAAVVVAASPTSGTARRSVGKVKHR